MTIISLGDLDLLVRRMIDRILDGNLLGLAARQVKIELQVVQLVNSNARRVLLDHGLDEFHLNLVIVAQRQVFHQQNFSTHL